MGTPLLLSLSRRRLVLVATLSLCAGDFCFAQALPAAGQGSFTGLGVPAGWEVSIARDVSADGSVVSGGVTRTTPGGQEQATFRWTRDGGLQLLHDPPRHSQGLRMSGDGSVIVGFVGNPPPSEEAYRWTPSGGFVTLGTLPTPPAQPASSRAFDVSADGQVVVGSSSSNAGPSEAFRWTAGGGKVGLGVASPGGPGPWGSEASAVSADGGVVAGTLTGQRSEAFRWTAATGIVSVGGVGSQALGISADGSTIVGSRSVPGGGEAFRWTQAGGITGLGDLPGGDVDSLARAASRDGSTVVGRAATSLGEEAFIWDASRGMRNLREVLVSEYGLAAPLNGWTLNFALEISPDARFLVGVGTSPAGRREAWLVDLVPEPGACGAVAFALVGLFAGRRRRGGYGAG